MTDMNPIEMIAEWRRGCGNSVGTTPEACKECTDQLVMAIESYYRTPQQNAEMLARWFHDAYERLAPNFGYETRKDTKEFDPNSPNGRLMQAVCLEVVGRAQVMRYTQGYDAATRIMMNHVNRLNDQLSEARAEVFRLSNELQAMEILARYVAVPAASAA